MSDTVQEFGAITQYGICQQLVEWLGQQVTGAAARMAKERKEWISLPTQIEKTGAMEKQLTEANSRTQALKEELKKAQELLAIHAD